MKIKTPDNEIIAVRALGLSYYDPVAKKGVLIAELKSSAGMVLLPNQVLYPDALTDCKAAIRYTYTKAGIEQDLIIQEQPPSPSDYGLSDDAYLELFTEILSPVVPKRNPHVKNGMKVDQVLDFGEAKIFPGKAFMVGDSAPKRSVTVDKEWVTIDGRRFIIERIPHRQIKDQLATLPVGQGASKPQAGSVRHIVSTKPLLPKRFGQSKPAGKMKVAQGRTGVSPVSERATRSAPKPRPMSKSDIEPFGPGGEPEDQKQATSTATDRFLAREGVGNLGTGETPVLRGFVIDWALVSSATNFTFCAGTTYLVTNDTAVNLSGLTVIEGTTVIKRGTNTQIYILGGIDCKTGPYRPFVITAAGDNTIGESISGCTNQFASGTALFFNNEGYSVDLKYFRISRASTGIYFANTSSAVLSHFQITDCDLGVQLPSPTVKARNGLMCNVNTCFLGWSSVTAENLTMHLCGYAGVDDGGFSMHMTNSLLVAVTNLGAASINEANCYWFTNDPENIFQTVGGGSHYLANGSPYRNLATTNINPILFRELQAKTTYPPVILTNDITVDTVIEPQAERDTAVTCVGYHYDPLDLCIGNKNISGATLLVTNGAAIGLYFAGEFENFGTLLLDSGGVLACAGDPVNPVRIVWFNTVQEEVPVDWSWYGARTMCSLGFSYYPGGAVQVRCRFTEFSRMAGDGFHVGLGDVGWPACMSFRDCRFYGSGNYFMGNGYTSGGGLDLVITNCLFHRATCSFWAASQSFVVRACNNLFYTTAIELDSWTFDPPDLSDYLFKNNLFYSNSISQGAYSTNYTLTHSYNAYMTNCNRLTNGSAPVGDVILTNLEFQAGDLGPFYYPTNLALTPIDAGSYTNAADAGFYHYTTTTNNVKEATNHLDIGFHYIATSNGLPFDGDEDGLPDYFEDTNGNGQYDSGVDLSDWTSADTDGDSVSDYLEWLQGRSLKAEDTTADSGNSVKLRVFTPLE